MTGKFITVEGIEGAGKTTCMQVVTEVIEHQGINAIHTREPGGTDLGEDLRSLLLGHIHTGMSDDAELLMMFAARAEHIAQKIQPALDDGKWVLCDRFTDATYAYQGYGRGIPLEKIAGLENWVQGELRPDLTLLMDLPVEVGMERAGKRSAPDRFESEAWDFFERIRQGYLSIAAEQPSRVKVIDASQDLPDVQAQVRVAIEDFVNA
jgi:dTMP kinase